MPRTLADLDPGQQRVVAGWFPTGVEVVRDLSWGLVDTTVLHLRESASGAEVVLKAGGPDDRHAAREIEGYAAADAVWTRRDLAPRLLHADAAHRVVAVSRLPGRLARDLPEDTEVHRQAGAALALLHGSASRVDPDVERRQRDHSRALLDAEHRIPPAAAAWLREWLDSYDPGPTVVVATHGDYSPRNWLVDHTPAGPRLRVIDLGRFDHRPAASDLCRLHERHWRTRPDLAAAFVEGYGADPRSGALWTAQRIREAIGTATWALRVGDGAFEREGLATVAELVAGR